MFGKKLGSPTSPSKKKTESLEKLKKITKPKSVLKKNQGA